MDPGFESRLNKTYNKTEWLWWSCFFWQIGFPRINNDIYVSNKSKSILPPRTRSRLIVVSSSRLFLVSKPVPTFEIAVIHLEQQFSLKSWLNAWKASGRSVVMVRTNIASISLSNKTSYQQVIWETLGSEGSVTRYQRTAGIILAWAKLPRLRRNSR